MATAILVITEADVHNLLGWLDDPLARQLSPGEVDELCDKIRDRLEEVTEKEMAEIVSGYLDKVHDRRICDV